MIGQTVFCLDPKTKNIFKAIKIGTNITENGYELVRLLLSDDSTKSLEAAHVHNNETEADQHMLRVYPLLEEADQIIKEATEKVDKIRIQVIGEPKFKELAEKIKR